MLALTFGITIRMSLQSYSPDFRRDHDLPHVHDADPERERKLAELIIGFVSDELPAVGIVSDSVEFDDLDHEEVHLSHQKLIMKALRRIKPRLLVDSPFETSESFTSTHTKIHRDGYWPPSSRRGLTAIWKLHTAGKKSAADVLLANSSQGSVICNVMQIGEEGLYAGVNPRDELSDLRGYDPENERGTPDYLFDFLLRQSYEPTLTAPDVYHFSQPSFGSLLIKAVSAVGPSTVHGFRAVSGARRVLTSNMTVVTNSEAA